MLKNLFGSKKPKDKFSLENLKSDNTQCAACDYGVYLWDACNRRVGARYLYATLQKEHVITSSNAGRVIETLRALGELMIWGDQHSEGPGSTGSQFFEFFAEKNLLAHFVRILNQRCENKVKVQVIQTLSILFQNLSNEVSVFYLLSNNYINDMIVHRGFDFADEEIATYYINFLKSLSFKLNKRTILFFFNEVSQDFPLLNEAIKFFNHPDAMIRIAVRTLTLNVFRINDLALRRYLLSRAALPYFTHLVWFLRDQTVELDKLMHGAGGGASSKAQVASAAAATAAALAAAGPAAAAAMALSPSPSPVSAALASSSGSSMPLSAAKLDVCVEHLLDQLFYIQDVLNCGEGQQEVEGGGFTQRDDTERERAEAAALAGNNAHVAASSSSSNGSSNSSGGGGAAVGGLYFQHLLSEVLLDQLLGYYVLPLLCGSLAPHLSKVPGHQLISARLALFMLGRVVEIFSHTAFVNSILRVLVSSSLPPIALRLIAEPPRGPVRNSDGTPLTSLLYPPSREARRANVMPELLLLHQEPTAPPRSGKRGHSSNASIGSASALHTPRPVHAAGTPASISRPGVFDDAASSSGSASAAAASAAVSPTPSPTGSASPELARSTTAEQRGGKDDMELQPLSSKQELMDSFAQAASEQGTGAPGASAAATTGNESASSADDASSTAAASDKSVAPSVSESAESAAVPAVAAAAEAKEDGSTPVSDAAAASVAPAASSDTPAAIVATPAATPTPTSDAAAAAAASTNASSSAASAPAVAPIALPSAAPSSAAPRPAPLSPPPEGGWACLACTLVNPPGHMACSACSSVRPLSPGAAEAVRVAEAAEAAERVADRTNSTAAATATAAASSPASAPVSTSVPATPISNASLASAYLPSAPATPSTASASSLRPADENNRVRSKLPEVGALYSPIDYFHFVKPEAVPAGGGGVTSLPPVPELQHQVSASASPVLETATETAATVAPATPAASHPHVPSASATPVSSSLPPSSSLSSLSSSSSLAPGSVVSTLLFPPLGSAQASRTDYRRLADEQEQNEYAQSLLRYLAAAQQECAPQVVNHVAVATAGIAASESSSSPLVEVDAATSPLSSPARHQQGLDERDLYGSMALLYALLRHEKADPDLLFGANLAAQSHRKQRRLLQALVHASHSNGGNGSDTGLTGREKDDLLMSPSVLETPVVVRQSSRRGSRAGSKSGGQDTIEEEKTNSGSNSNNPLWGSPITASGAGSDGNGVAAAQAALGAPADAPAPQLSSLSDADAPPADAPPAETPSLVSDPSPPPPAAHSKDKAKDKKKKKGKNKAKASASNSSGGGGAEAEQLEDESAAPVAEAAAAAAASSEPSAISSSVANESNSLAAPAAESMEDAATSGLSVLSLEDRGRSVSMADPLLQRSAHKRVPSITVGHASSTSGTVGVSKSGSFSSSVHAAPLFDEELSVDGSGSTVPAAGSTTGGSASTTTSSSSAVGEAASSSSSASALAYNETLVSQLLSLGAHRPAPYRMVTLQMAAELLREFVVAAEGPLPSGSSHSSSYLRRRHAQQLDALYALCVADLHVLAASAWSPLLLDLVEDEYAAFTSAGPGCDPNASAAAVKRAMQNVLHLLPLETNNYVRDVPMDYRVQLSPFSPAAANAPPVIAPASGFVAPAIASSPQPLSRSASGNIGGFSSSGGRDAVPPALAQVERVRKVVQLLLFVRNLRLKNRAQRDNLFYAPASSSSATTAPPTLSPTSPTSPLSPNNTTTALQPSQAQLFHVSHLSLRQEVLTAHHPDAMLCTLHVADLPGAKKKQHLFFVVDEWDLLLVELQQNKPGTAIVQLRQSLTHAEGIVNRNNGCLLHVVVRSTSKPHSSARRLPYAGEQLWRPLWALALLFLDAVQAARALRHLESRRTTLRKNMLAKLLDECERPVLQGSPLPPADSPSSSSATAVATTAAPVSSPAADEVRRTPLDELSLHAMAAGGTAAYVHPHLDADVHADSVLFGIPNLPPKPVPTPTPTPTLTAAPTPAQAVPTTSALAASSAPPAAGATVPASAATSAAPAVPLPVALPVSASASPPQGPLSATAASGNVSAAPAAGPAAPSSPPPANLFDGPSSSSAPAPVSPQSAELLASLVDGTDVRRASDSPGKNLFSS